jgi:hypothetical protein
LHRITNIVFDILVKAVGGAAATGLSSLLSGWWAALLHFGVKPSESALNQNTVGVQNQAHVFGEIAWQALQAWLVLFAVSFTFSCLWFTLVTWRRPGSPLEADAFRRYWLSLAGLLVMCAGVLYVILINLPAFSALRDLTPQYQAIGLLLFTSGSFLFLYTMSLLCSPSTVIAAVPFGQYYARLRW